MKKSDDNHNYYILSDDIEEAYKHPSSDLNIEYVPLIHSRSTSPLQENIIKWKGVKNEVIDGSTTSASILSSHSGSIESISYISYNKQQTNHFFIKHERTRFSFSFILKFTSSTRCCLSFNFFS